MSCVKLDMILRDTQDKFVPREERDNKRTEI